MFFIPVVRALNGFWFWFWAGVDVVRGLAVDIGEGDGDGGERCQVLMNDLGDKPVAVAVVVVEQTRRMNTAMLKTFFICYLEVV